MWLRKLGTSQAFKGVGAKKPGPFQNEGTRLVVKLLMDNWPLNYFPTLVLPRSGPEGQRTSSRSFLSPAHGPP